MTMDIIYVILIFLLLLSLILVIIFTQHEKKDHVHVSECSKPKGEYAVDPGIVSVDIIKTCGQSNGPCTFRAPNLKGAIDICNKNPDKCYKFTYDNRRKVISFIDNSTNYSSNNDYDIYTRQT
jgi:hypothetical protein